MRDLINAADYHAYEIDVMLHLCETIDGVDDDMLAEAFPVLHAVMREHMRQLTRVINALASRAE